MARSCHKTGLLALLAVSINLYPMFLRAQEKVTIGVDLSSNLGPWRPVWNFFGHDEPNYTYMKFGRCLLGDLAALCSAPVYIRTHNLLTSGDGTSALKWGSTNAYTEDPSGRPLYNWGILDRIFDTYREKRVRPLVEIGFMPKALSINPDPYQHTWPKGGISTGWAFPPKDYSKWADLIYQWVRHAMDRYGSKEVESWYWEVWNEPDISYWRGTPEEYHKLYDFSAHAVKRALPSARIGGPHSTGPGGEKSAQFLRAFLEHCTRGTNYATGKTGSPLDYIGFHAKGSPKMVDGHVQMGMQKQALDIAKGFEIVASFPDLREKPIIIGESDPEGCAACSARVYPQNAYRNGTMYSSYTAAMFHKILALAERHQVHLEGVVTWAFEFEDQPWFDGFRTLATNGVAKPVLNVFRMLGLMSGNQTKVESSGAISADSLLQSGVREKPDINALATQRDREATILLWSYHDDDVPSAAVSVQIEVRGFPASVQRIQLRHYRIDENHSNAYTVWKQMGSPQSVSSAQQTRLQSAGRLELQASPEWLWNTGGKVRLDFPLPRQAVSLLQLSW